MGRAAGSDSICEFRCSGASNRLFGRFRGSANPGPSVRIGTQGGAAWCLIILLPLRAISGYALEPPRRDGSIILIDAPHPLAPQIPIFSARPRVQNSEQSHVARHSCARRLASCRTFDGVTALIRPASRQRRSCESPPPRRVSWAPGASAVDRAEPLARTLAIAASIRPVWRAHAEIRGTR